MINRGFSTGGVISTDAVKKGLKNHIFGNSMLKTISLQLSYSNDKKYSGIIPQNKHINPYTWYIMDIIPLLIRLEQMFFKFGFLKCRH